MRVSSGSGGDRGRRSARRGRALSERGAPLLPPLPPPPGPTLCTPHPTPYTLHPTPYTLHPTPHTLHPAPYTLPPKPQTLSVDGLSPSEAHQSFRPSRLLQVLFASQNAIFFALQNTDVLLYKTQSLPNRGAPLLPPLPQGPFCPTKCRFCCKRRFCATKPTKCENI